MNEPTLFAINDPMLARERHHWLMPRLAVPTPILDGEWEKISKALLAAGEHELQDRINRRRSALLSDLSELTWVAEQVRERNDPREICSADVTLHVKAVVTFSGHGSFGPDGHVSAMVDDFNREKAYRVRDGLGALSESVTARRQIYCG